MTKIARRQLQSGTPAGEMLFHYAPESYLSKILRSGELLPSNSGAPHERKMLWFSANQSWEPTATKLTMIEGRLNAQSFQEQYERQGCIRFALPSGDNRLMGWRSACRAARTTSRQRQALEESGISQGATPSDWFATTDSIPLAQLRLQVLLGDFGWQDWPADQAQAHEAHLATLDQKTTIPSHGMAFLQWRASQANDPTWSVAQRA